MTTFDSGGPISPLCSGGARRHASSGGEGRRASPSFTTKTWTLDNDEQPGDTITADFLLVNTTPLFKAGKILCRISWTLRDARRPSYYVESDNDEDAAVDDAARDGAELEEAEVAAGDRTEVTMEVKVDSSFKPNKWVENIDALVSPALGLDRLESWINAGGRRQHQQEQQQQQQHEHSRFGPFERDPQPHCRRDKIWAVLASCAFWAYKLRYLSLFSFVCWVWLSPFEWKDTLLSVVEKKFSTQREQPKRWGGIAVFCSIIAFLGFPSTVVMILPFLL